MKTTTIIIAAVLALQVNVLFAGNESASAPAATENTLIALAPATPVEATFEDFSPVTIAVRILAPVVPMEAEFEDVVPEPIIDVASLAPATPAEADFNDSTDQETDLSALAPVTPAVADFE